jgi:hypothetical protein
LLGYALGSDSDSESVRKEQSKVVSGDAYVNGDAIRRVRDLLDIKTSCSGSLSFQDKETRELAKTTFRGLFRRICPKDPEAYEILRITRIVAQSDPKAIFWFEFIEKDKLVPKA